MRTPLNGGVHIGSYFNKKLYMHEQTTIEFDVRIMDRKNLNWCTPFSGVSLCNVFCSPAYEHCSGPMVQHYCHGVTIFTHPIAVRTLFNVIKFKLKTLSDPTALGRDFKAQGILDYFRINELDKDGRFTTRLTQARRSERAFKCSRCKARFFETEKELKVHKACHTDTEDG